MVLASPGSNLRELGGLVSLRFCGVALARPDAGGCAQRLFLALVDRRAAAPWLYLSGRHLA